MKDVLLRMLIWLLLGAIVNVAVAWGCVAGEQPRTHHLPLENLGFTYTFGEGPTVGLPLRVIRWVDREDIRLIWPGFALNTIFYAAILWLLFATPFKVRRWRRRRRGLCPACAYPVGQSEVCTECGKAVVATG